MFFGNLPSWIWCSGAASGVPGSPSWGLLELSGQVLRIRCALSVAVGLERDCSLRGSALSVSCCRRCRRGHDRSWATSASSPWALPVGWCGGTGVGRRWPPPTGASPAARPCRLVHQATEPALGVKTLQCPHPQPLPPPSPPVALAPQSPPVELAPQPPPVELALRPPPVVPVPPWCTGLCLCSRISRARAKARSASLTRPARFSTRPRLSRAASSLMR